MLKGLLWLSFVLLMVSCGINSNIMFKTPKDQQPQLDSLLTKVVFDYKIQSDDKLWLQLEPNNGVALLSGVGNALTSTTYGSLTSEYIVRSDGKVEFPLVGDLLVKGMTIKELEDTLEKCYQDEYNTPFVRIRVTNHRVIVFPGSGGDAKVIPLVNTQTTIMEALAGAGGISERGKASTVKLMRMEGAERKVYTLDLSIIDNVKYGDILVQPNDYLYVEPSDELLKESVERITPAVAILANLVVLISFFITN